MRGGHSRSSTPQVGTSLAATAWPFGTWLLLRQPTSAPEDVLSVSDVATEAGDQAWHTRLRPRLTADAIMADEEASNIVSVLSSPSEPSTLRSTVLQEEAESSPSHSLESPIKRKPGTKASAGRAQSKKLRQSVGQASKQPLGSIPKHGQQPVEDLT